MFDSSHALLCQRMLFNRQTDYLLHWHIGRITLQKFFVSKAKETVTVHVTYISIDELFIWIRPTEKMHIASTYKYLLTSWETSLKSFTLVLYYRKIQDAFYELGRCKRRERWLAYERDRIPLSQGMTSSDVRHGQKFKIIIAQVAMRPFVENIIVERLFEGLRNTLQRMVARSF